MTENEQKIHINQSESVGKMVKEMILVSVLNW